MLMDQAQLATLISNAVSQQLNAVLQRQQQFPAGPQTLPAGLASPLLNVAAAAPAPTLTNNPPGFNTPNLKRTLSATSTGSSTEVKRSRSRSLSRSSSLSCPRKRRRQRDYLDDESDDAATIVYSSSSSETEQEEESQAQERYEEEDMVPRLKKRRRVKTQLSKDKKFIAPYVNEEFDEEFLKKRNSPLFRHMLKRTRNPDGTRSLKKNPDIVIGLFKRLIRPLLRRVLGKVALEEKSVLERYYNAALAVVKKKKS